MNVIKFRGVTTFLNKTVYGDLLHYEDGGVGISEDVQCFGSMGESTAVF